MNVKYATIIVRDMEESLRFYTEVMGFAVDSRHTPFPGAEIILLKGGGDAMVELIKNADDAPGLYSVGMEVGDMDATIRDLTSKGATITKGPLPISVGTLAFIEDPNGVRIALIHHH